jgi:hypothetical protein
MHISCKFGCNCRFSVAIEVAIKIFLVGSGDVSMKNYLVH